MTLQEVITHLIEFTDMAACEGASGDVLGALNSLIAEFQAMLKMQEERK